MIWCGGSADITFGLKKTKSMYARKHVCQTLQGHTLSGMIWEKHTCIFVGPFPICLSSSNIQDYPRPQMPWNLSLGISRISLDCTEGYQRLVWTTSSNGICTSMTKRSPRNKEMFTLLKVVGERARSPTTFVMITNQKCQLYLKNPAYWQTGF